MLCHHCTRAKRRSWELGSCPMMLKTDASPFDYDGYIKYFELKGCHMDVHLVYTVGACQKGEEEGKGVPLNPLPNTCTAVDKMERR